MDDFGLMFTGVLVDLGDLWGWYGTGIGFDVYVVFVAMVCGFNLGLFCFAWLLSLFMLFQAIMIWCYYFGLLIGWVCLACRGLLWLRLLVMSGFVWYLIADLTFGWVSLWVTC